MPPITPDITDAIARLEAEIAAAHLPPREAARCAALVAALRRPVRVGLFGPPDIDHRPVLTAILGRAPLADSGDWPPVEVTHGAEAAVTATLADGRRLHQAGRPGPELMALRPVFVQLALPEPALEGISYLHVPPVADGGAQMRALAWAAKRLDIAVWCTARYAPREAATWAAAPEALRQHAVLAVLAPASDIAHLRRRSGPDFDGIFALGPDGREVTALRQRLSADIDEARRADIDAARLLVHRYGNAPCAGREAPPTAAEATPPTPAVPPAQLPREDAGPARACGRAVLSEPILYLRRRARGLLEHLEWQVSDPGWPADALAHCAETLDALRDRASDWPDDDPGAAELRDGLDRAGDMIVLLGIEGGPEQAEDAAMLLAQLRGDFDRAVAA